MTQTTTTVPVQEGHLAVTELGSGHPVVLLHGGVLDHRMWQPQLGLLAREHRVIAPDLRGHGRSSTPTAPFQHGEDVAALLRALDTGPVTLVGISLGAGTAVDIAVEHPDLVAGLVINGAGASNADFRDPWTVGRVAAWADAARAQDRQRWLEVYLEIGAGPYRTPADVDPAVTRLVRTIAEDTLREHVADGAPVLPTPPDRIRERSRGLPVPVRAVLGTLDSDDHQRMPREIADTATHGDVVEIPGAAHYPNLEQPDAFTDTVLDFLARHAGP